MVSIFNSYFKIDYSMSESEFRCDVCKKLFSGKSALTLHRKSIHERSTRVSCEFCLREFSWRSHLVSHARICKAQNVTQLIFISHILIKY